MAKRRVTVTEMGARLRRQSFDESVRKHHSELRHVRADIKTRTTPEVVRHFGHWKACALFWLTECIIDKV